jgi:hypothetical protein
LVQKATVLTTAEVSERVPATTGTTAIVAVRETEPRMRNHIGRSKFPIADADGRRLRVVMTR